MDMVINVALMLLGAAATLTAFGGETWEKGAAPLIERIKLRGWLSLLCLASSVVLSVVREARIHQREARDRIAAIEAKSQLDKANERQIALSQELQASVNKQQVLENENRLIALSTGAAIRSVTWNIDFSIDSPPDAGEMGVWGDEPVGAPYRNWVQELCAGVPDYLRPVAQVQVYLNPEAAINVHSSYSCDGHRSKNIAKSTVFAQPAAMTFEQRYEKRNYGISIYAYPNGKKGNLSAATAFTNLTYGHPVGLIAFELQKDFAKLSDMQRFNSEHPELNKKFDLGRKAPFTQLYVLPAEVGDELAVRWQRLLSNPSYEVHLDTQGAIMISSDLALKQISKGEWYVDARFDPIGIPKISSPIRKWSGRFPASP